MADEGGEKTEEPTQKKLDDARKKGQVWKSKDFTGVASFLVAMGVLKGTWDNIQGEMAKLYRYGFEKLAHPRDLDHAVLEILFIAVKDILILSLPVALAAAVVGGMVDFLTVGPLFSIESIMPKMEKLNPIEGAKNLFGKKQFVELFKSSAKLLVTGYVVYGVVRDSMPLVVATIGSSAEGLIQTLGELVYRVTAKVAVLFLIFGVFDVWFQRRSFMKDMMMSKDEVKREYKESEGDPHHKAARKQMHHEILEGAMMEAVKTADVVVTNPDHVAIALQYDKSKDQAPRLIAKGIDSKAEAIKALAKNADVPMMRNVPLAHALLRIDLGQEVPEALYDAVAEVLNFVYGIKEQQAAAGSPTPPRAVA
jgi:flagellar biosynthetic protein FlhB